MNWDAIGAVGEVLGALAVVFTLIYLARQIGVQTRSTNVVLYDSILEGFNKANALLAENQELASLWDRGNADPDSLSDNEASQFSWLFRLYNNQFLKAYQFHQKGVLSDDDWSNFGAQGAVIMKTPGGKRWVENGRGTFVEFFDALEKIETSTDTVSFTVKKT